MYGVGYCFLTNFNLSRRLFWRLRFGLRWGAFNQQVDFSKTNILIKNKGQKNFLQLLPTLIPKQGLMSGTIFANCN